MPAHELDIELKPSRLYATGLCSLHLSTYLLLIGVDLPQPLYGQLFLLVFLLSLRSWRHWHGLVLWRRLIIRNDQIRLVGERRECDAVLDPQVLQAAWLVMLPLRLRSGRLWLPVLPDSVFSDDWRRLRVWLNSGSQKVKH